MRCFPLSEEGHLISRVLAHKQARKPPHKGGFCVHAPGGVRSTWSGYMANTGRDSHPATSKPVRNKRAQRPLQWHSPIGKRNRLTLALISQFHRPAIACSLLTLTFFVQCGIKCLPERTRKDSPWMAQNVVAMKKSGAPESNSNTKKIRGGGQSGGGEHEFQASPSCTAAIGPDVVDVRRAL